MHRVNSVCFLIHGNLVHRVQCLFYNSWKFSAQGEQCLFFNSWKFSAQGAQCLFFISWKFSAQGAVCFLIHRNLVHRMHSAF